VAVGYFLGTTMYIVEIRVACTYVPVTWTVFCWYGRCINQQLQ